MILSDTEQSEGIIFASDGTILCRLRLHRPSIDARPVLVDAAGTLVQPAAGTLVQPWEVELLRWPSLAEAELRRGGYLTERHWSLAEPWCNCAD